MIQVMDRIIGLLVRRRVQVSIGSGTRLKWWGLRGNRGGCLGIGRESLVGCRVMFDSPGGRISIGDRSYIGASLLVCHSGITIGDDVLISWGVTIVDHDSHSPNWRVRSKDVSEWMVGRKSWDGVSIRPVHVANRAWIGFGAVILKGVTIGEGAIVGAGSVVTRSVPPYSIVAGNPARVIRELDASAELLADRS
jgi:acetyltransferase-like isoleucine patch superfamily enzyme